jgi:hypothetical protein
MIDDVSIDWRIDSWIIAPSLVNRSIHVIQWLIDDAIIQ